MRFGFCPCNDWAAFLMQNCNTRQDHCALKPCLYNAPLLNYLSNFLGLF